MKELIEKWRREAELLRKENEITNSFPYPAQVQRYYDAAITSMILEKCADELEAHCRDSEEVIL